MGHIPVEYKPLRNWVCLSLSLIKKLGHKPRVSAAVQVTIQGPHFEIRVFVSWRMTVLVSTKEVYNMLHGRYISGIQEVYMIYSWYVNTKWAQKTVMSISRVSNDSS